jgi:structure-specific recognition protein 1
MAFRGLNYGQLRLEEETKLQLLHRNQPVFSLNYETISNSTINKHDIIIETTADDLGNDDCLCEIRLHVEEPKEEREEAEGQRMEEEEEPKAEESAVEKIYKHIVERAKIGEFAGESIATLLDVNLAVPRGKYTIDFYQKSIRFHGMTFNYNVEYRNITKGFILPMTNEAQVSVVLQLNKDRPIYQGQTVYRYIVVQIKKEIEVDIKTKLNPELLEKAPHLKDLQQEYAGPQFQVFVDLLHATGSISLIQPGSHYKSKQGQPCVKANIKAQPGWLYMLKQSIIFIPKPVLYFRVEDIFAAEFHRINAANKQFDLKVSIRDEKKEVEFLGIERGELDSLVEYFRARQVKVIMEQTEQPKIMAEADDDESEDEDFEAGEEDESDSESDNDELGSEEESESKNKKPKKGKKEGQEEESESKSKNRKVRKGNKEGQEPTP